MLMMRREVTMSSDSMVRLTLRSYADGPSEVLMLPAQRADPGQWPASAGVMVCDPPPPGDIAPGVMSLQVHDLLAETGHLQVAAALDELGRYRVLAHRLMVAVVGALLIRSGVLLCEPERAHDDMRDALNRLIDQAVEQLA
jgi:hypothetical protein